LEPPVPASTRDRIIEASAALFMQRGLAGSGLKQIAAESEATIGSLYHWFPGGKDELAAETLRASGAAYQALVEAVLDAAPDIVTAVADCFAGAAEALRASGFADACPVATVALEVASSDEQLRQVTAEVFESWLRAGSDRFEGGGIEPTRARELATLLVAALEGGFLLSRAANDTAPMEAIGRVMTDLVRAEVGVRA
jgi:AcrR family transcriptional regulator